MLYLEYNETQFMDYFQSWESRRDSFSYEALKAIYQDLVEYSDSTGEDIEICVISICCRYTEYDNIKDALECFDYNTREELEDNFQVIEFEGGVLTAE